MLMFPSELARTLSAAADRIEALAHSSPCRAFRPHGGWRSGQMYAGLIMVMHDGDESAPRKDQRQTVDGTARLIPALRARGFDFGTVCRNGG